MPSQIPIPTKKQISDYRNTDTPYYTTYPPGGAWENDYSKAGFYRELDALKVTENKDAAIYVHVPFCEKLCYFCFCYTKIIKDKNKPQVLQTIDAIDKEIQLYERAFGDREKPVVRQLQWGGGTPNYLSEQQFNKLMGSLKSAFSLDLLDEFALEVDPRTVSTQDIQKLNAFGVNRISMGIQDFNPQVQEAINRVQPLDFILELIETMDDGTSLNFDLIYGLPHQTVSTFSETIDTCIKIGADRLSIYCYDHTPDIHRHHALMNPLLMPSKSEKIEMFIMAAQSLINAGYEWIGIDHFAKRDDSLSMARDQGKLGRTLNGYSVFRDFSTEFGIGPSAISSLNKTYTQNVKDLAAHANAVHAGEFPIFRGWDLDDDDLLRREVIMELILYGRYSFSKFEKRFEKDMLSYFKGLSAALERLQRDNLIEENDLAIEATPLGRYYIHQIARIFDKYSSASSDYVRTHAAIKLHEKNS